MKRIFSKIYAWLLLIALIAGSFAAVYVAWNNVDALVEVVCGFVVSALLAPVFHELGHVAFAKSAGMKTVYCKCFCFRFQRVSGKTKIFFCNPFAADETQVLPMKSGNMQSRLQRYAVGGLVFGGIYFIVILAGAVILTAIGHTKFLFWGALPYAAYLFLLNVLPFEYPSGKTDALVYRGLKKGYDAESVMIAVMEIQAKLYEGTTFSEMDGALFYDLPQLPEDEPVYAVLLDLRYRYEIANENYEKARDALVRLADIQAYLTDTAFDGLLIELAYFGLLQGEDAALKDAFAQAETLLKSDDYRVKRTLALYSSLIGETVHAEELIRQARESLVGEEIIGLKKFEGELLDRIKIA